MAFRNVEEGVRIALDQLQVNKLRSGLTILGVVIGVATVMAIASLVQGIRQQIFKAIEVAGPSTFYAVRYFSQVPLNPDNLPYDVRIRPIVSAPDVVALKQTPQIGYAGLWVQLFQRMEYLGTRTQTVTVFGADEHYSEIQGGTLLRGRWFSRGELNGSQVAVLELDVAEKLFGQLDPMGKSLTIGAKPFTIIGVFQNPSNIFQPPGQQIAAVIPFEAARQNFHYDNTNNLFIAVKPRLGVSVADARDAATVAMRRSRGLRPGDGDSFDLITQDQILSVIGNFTTYFFTAMIALSSVALMVGGIGVMAIMMVSVTDRTTEIGVRKALGATRQDILLQFLVEAATLTSIGGLLGIVVGVAFGETIKLVFGFDSSIPVWSAFLASITSVLIGLVFGMIPANRAAKLDPIEALRRE